MHKSWGTLKQLSEAWAKAELDPKKVAVLNSALKRRAAIIDEANHLMGEGGRAATKAIGERVAAGDISLKEGVIEHGLIESANGPTSAFNSTTRLRLLLEVTNSALMSEIEADLRTQDLPQFVSRKLTELLDQSAALDKQLLGIGSVEEAIKAGQKTADAWIKREQLGRRHAQVKEVLPSLGFLDLVSGARAA